LRLEPNGLLLVAESGSNGEAAKLIYARFIGLFEVALRFP
jgi:hypothetical protein